MQYSLYIVELTKRVILAAGKCNNDPQVFCTNIFQSFRQVFKLPRELWGELSQQQNKYIYNVNSIFTTEY